MSYFRKKPDFKNVENVRIFGNLMMMGIHYHLQRTPGPFQLLNKYNEIKLFSMFDHSQFPTACDMNILQQFLMNKFT